MCNLYRLHKGADAIRQIFDGPGQQLSFPEGIPNLRTQGHPHHRPRADRPNGAKWAGDGRPALELAGAARQAGIQPPVRRAHLFKPLPRDCRWLLRVHSARPTPKPKRKDKWLFSPVDGGLLGIAAVTRTVPDVGEAFSLLTAEPSPEVAPIHNRQIILPSPGSLAGVAGSFD